MATARSAWGIDIGNRALKAVRVVREGDGVRIADLEVIEHENILSNAGDNRETLVQTALTNFTQSHSLKKELVAIGVSGQSSFARFIKLPPVEPRQIPSIVRFEAIQQIPFPLEEVEWSYQLFRDEASPDVEVGIFAMRKELVQEHIKYFSDAGLNVQVVQMSPLAVYNGLYFDERLKGTTMVIDLGAETTDLIIAEGETIWLRSIPIGGNSFTEALVKSFKLRFEKAEDLKRNAATSKYGRQILQAMRPIFADLVAEIQRSIGFYASVHRDSRITKVLALGGTFRLPGLQKYLQQNLQLDVQKIDRLGNTVPADSKIAAVMSENLLSSVGAYGLALQAIGNGKITSSLLPQALQREREWRSKNKWFALAASCVVAGTGLQLGRYYYEQGQFNRDEVLKAQKDIDDTFKTGTGLAGDWKAVEGGGAAENANIQNLKSLGDYRELWENIYSDIVNSVPPPPSTQVDVARLGPRNTRKQVIIDDIKTQYKQDLSQVLPMDNQQVLQFVGSGDAAAAPAYGMGIRPPMGMAQPGNPGGSSGDTPPAAVLRGYLITIHCRTPYSEGLDLVTKTLRAGLEQKRTDTTALLQKGDAPIPQYIFQKIWIPHNNQLKDDKVRVQELKARARAAADRVKGNGPDFPQPGPGGIGMPAGPRGFGGPGIVHAPAPQGLSPLAPALPRAPGMEGAGADAADADPVDPLTNESIMSDWDVIVVVAVVLDPVKPDAATPDQSDQNQTPGNPAGPAQPAPGPHGPRSQGPDRQEPVAMR